MSLRLRPFWPHEITDTQYVRSSRDEGRGENRPKEELVDETRVV